MRIINQAIDRFCEKHPKFGIPHLIKFVIIFSAIFFLLDMLDERRALFSFMYFDPALIMQGHVWRLFTWVFFLVNPFNPHFPPSLLFALITFYFYFIIGTALEKVWGTAKFNIFYLSGILFNIIYGFISYYVFDLFFILNPFFLNLSLFFAFAVMFPNHIFMIMFIIPVKAKWLAIINGAFFGWSIIAPLLFANFGQALLPLIAILNFFIICGDELLFHSKQVRTQTKVQNKAQFSKYRRDVRKTKRDVDSKPYRHKCAVCGKTDTEYPDMEFRYCSRCEGFHCFCIDHINSHVHFQEK